MKRTAETPTESNPAALDAMNTAMAPELSQPTVVLDFMESDFRGGFGAQVAEHAQQVAEERETAEAARMMRRRQERQMSHAMVAHATARGAEVHGLAWANRGQ